MLARHHDITATVSLSGDNRHFRHGGFRIGVEQLRPVPYDAVILLRCARQKARHIDESYDRYVETIAKTNESRAFDRSIDMETSCRICWSIADDAHLPCAAAR